jgi:hypothetical protein
MFPSSSVFGIRGVANMKSLTKPAGVRTQRPGKKTVVKLGGFLS